MKPKHRIPLRLRLTLLTALVLIIVCVLLTLSSITTYNNYSVEPGKSPVQAVGTSAGFTRASVIFMFVMIIAGTIASWYIAGKALKPVTNLSRQIEDIGENRLFEPLAGFDTNDEVGKLAASFNHMLTRLEKAFVHQKQFAANAAHELKTPLASIIANIEVLKMDEDPTNMECMEVLEDTLVNAQRLSDLVYDLLRMNSALDADNCEAFEAKAMFDGIIASLSESVKHKNIQMKNDTQGVTLFGEKALLQRVFFNVVQNAVKYNKTGGEVIISAVRNGKETTIIISDTGIGIPKTELENIFEPFYRVDNSRSRETGGSGLGLSIVRSVIEKHKGRISIESEQGIFTKVIVALPDN